MESQVVREQDTNTVGLHSCEDEEEPGHEKKSVLKMVKAKDKKLKETIAKRAHIQEHGHDHVDSGLDDHDDEEDEDEERVNDPEVHRAPIYESAAAVNGVGPRSGKLGQVKNPREEVVPALANTPHSLSTAPEVDRVADRTIENFIRPFRAEEDPHSPIRRNDPAASYQTKVSDPAGLGSRGADVSQLLQSTRKLTIESEPISGMEQDHILTTGTGSHGSFSPESATESKHTNDDDEKATSQSRYARKIIWARDAIADKATSAKDVIISKLGFTDKDKSNPEIPAKPHANTTARGEEASDRSPTKGIASAVTEKFSPVYEKVVSKVRGGGSTGAKMDGGASVKDYLVEKLKPGEEDKALSGLISDALHKRKKEGMTGSVSPPLGESPRPQASGSDPETEVDVDKGKELREERAAVQESTI